MAARRAGEGLLLLLVAMAVAVTASALTFEDAQDEAGLSFTHASSDVKNYPETTGSGVCWGDLDGDGTDDLFLVNGRFSNFTQQATRDPRSALYLNRGDGTLEDVSAAWGADVSSWGQGCSLADHDDDGDQDLFVAGYGFVRLLRNDQDRLTDVTAAANLSVDGKCAGYPCFAESGSWADYDGDGDLDLYVANMVDYDLNATTPVVPGLYDGQPNVLFRNRGDGTFEDVTAQAGVDDDPGPDRSKSFMSLWADHDRDGDPDLYIASDTTPNTLFRNNGNGTFTDVAALAGVDDPRSSMGLVFQDVDHDGLPDLYMTHYQGENNGFYRNNGDGTFSDHSGEGGLGSDWPLVGWGTGFHDFDHDGDHDIYAVNGHTSTPASNFRQNASLWLRQADGTFVDASNQSGPSFQNASVARGSAVADYDLDGDLDLLLLEQHNNASRLLRHGGAAEGTHWLQVEVRQPGPRNRFAVGAEVTITPSGGPPLTRVVQASSSFLSQDSLVVHAGLGGATTAQVKVRWPDGTMETWDGIASDQRVRVVRGDPRPLGDTVSPRTLFLVDGAPAAAWYRAPVAVAVAASDRALGTPSGVAVLEAGIDGGWGPYEGPFPVATEGQHVLRARAIDAAGNREPLRTLRVGLDGTPPTSRALVGGMVGEEGWYQGMAVVRFEAEDRVSGLAGVWSRVDDGPWQVNATWTFASSGARTVTWYAKDIAGNVEAPQQVLVRVDRDAPQVELHPSPGTGVGGVALQAWATDPSSGVRRVAFYVNGASQPEHVDEDGSDGWHYTVREPGLHRVRAVATDGVGFPGQAEAWVLVLEVPPLLALPPLVLALRHRRGATR